MTSDLIKKITQKAGHLLFQSSRGYRSNIKSSMPYEQDIVVNPEYPEKVFLVVKNMMFERNSISDSSYDVYSFDENGDYLKKEDVSEIGNDFFRTMKVLKKI
jgi:hypothetical protein